MQPEATRPNQKLQQERLSRHWSQQELAGRLGTTKVNVSRWERGITSPGPYFRHQLCLLFDKTPEELGLVPQQSLPLPSQSADDAPLQQPPSSQQSAPSESLKLRPSHQWAFRPHFRISSTKKLALLLLLLLGGSTLLIWSGWWGKGTIALESSPLRYAADWHIGFDHWAGTPFWQWSPQERGMIFTTTAVPNYLLAAPTHPLIPPYTIEAQIQRQGYGTSTADGRDYGVVVQMVGGAGYQCGVGIHYLPEHEFLASIYIFRAASSTSQLPYYGVDDLASSPLALDTQWHTYRIEVTEDSITCSIDNRFLLPASIAAIRREGSVGIFVDHAAIAVRSFRILCKRASGEPSRTSCL